MQSCVQTIPIRVPRAAALCACLLWAGLLCACAATGLLAQPVPDVAPADTASSLPGDTSAAAVGPAVNPTKLAIVGGITVAGFVAGYALQDNLWWKGAGGAFHFDWDHDWRYALGADKLGHFYFPYAVTTIYAQAFRWCGMDTVGSLWWAGGLALAHQTFVEVRDGFSRQWGFSWGDVTANTLGAALPVAAGYVPALQAVRVKLSYDPSEKFRAGGYRAIIDDYESTYHWASVGLRDLVPAAWRGDVPAWLAIAVGHSVKGLDLAGAGHHEIYLALDWNLEGLPGDGWFWNLLKKNLNLYHLPSPAVRILPGVVWYGLKL